MKLFYFVLIIPVLMVVFAFQTEISTLMKGQFAKLSDVAPVLQTNTVVYTPGGYDDVFDGECIANSLVTPVSTAWICSVDGDTYDPCISSGDEEAIICGSHPLQSEHTFAVNLTSSLPDPNISDDVTEAVWVVELASGRKCTHTVGESREVDDEIVSYVCESNNPLTDVVIVGPLKKGKLWNATRAVIGNSDSEEEGVVVQKGIVPLKTIWLVEA